MTSTITVSVVIPCYNSTDTIVPTLAALTSQKTAFNYQVIVVNSSADATPDMVRQRFPEVELVQLSQRASAAKARNLGAAEATGRFIAFLDSDCLVTTDWLQMMVDNFNADYSGIGGPIENGNPESAISWAGYLLEFSDFFPCTNPVPVAHIPSGNLLLPLKTFIEAAGFPEDFHFAQEDRLFSWTLSRKTGKAFLFHPDIKVFHSHRAGVRQFLRHQYQIGRGGAEILKITDLPGSGLVRKQPLLTALLLPFVALRKLCRCLGRGVRHNPKPLFSKPHIIAAMGMGQLCWMAGFARQLSFCGSNKAQIDNIS